jgi:hypothetical protein
MLKPVKTLLNELIESVEGDIRSIELQLLSMGAEKIVDIHSHGEATSLHKALLQYLVLLSVLRDEAKRL